jgi:hypothetical protein
MHNNREEHLSAERTIQQIREKGITCRNYKIEIKGYCSNECVKCLANIGSRIIRKSHLQG